MKKERAIRLAYAAGLIDGEGYIGIEKIVRLERKGQPTRYYLRVTVTQKDGKVMDWLYGNFGGKIHKGNNHNQVTDNWIYWWRIENSPASDFLKQILPFLKIKRNQAEIAIRFQSRMKLKSKQVTVHEINEREGLCQALKKAKKDYFHATAPFYETNSRKPMVQAERLSEETPKGDAIV